LFPVVPLTDKNSFTFMLIGETDTLKTHYVAFRVLLSTVVYVALVALVHILIGLRQRQR